MLKLPKSLVSHPKHEALTAFLAKNARPLRDGGVPGVEAVFVPLDEGLRSALRVALGTRHLTQGLEAMGETLEKEAKGLRLVQEKTGQAPAQRASRLLILANDGSERFYRDAERLLAKHGDRLMAMVADATSELLGAFTAKGNAAKALMIDDRDALALFLSSYADHIS